MLVAFALTNYACFRDRQVLSLEAVPRTSTLHAFQSGCRQAPLLNRVSAIYGPNGTGKSRLVRALMFVRDLLLGSATRGHPGDLLHHTPFLLDTETQSQPSHFEIRFIEAGAYYEYDFSLDDTRVHTESLLCWPPGGRRRRLLTRAWTGNGETYDCEIGPSVPGPKDVWRRSTRPNALLVSVASNLNSDTFAPVVKWFHRLRFIGPTHFPEQFTVEAVRSSDGKKSEVLELLRDADIAVTDFSILKKTIEINALKEDLPPRLLSDLSRSGQDSLAAYRTLFAHEVRGRKRPRYFDLRDESEGTQRLFALAGPWLDLLDKDLVVFADELDRSLHPLLVASLIGRINSGDLDDRVRRAQLVATLHDTHALRDALGRGQVWFTEKDKHEAATLTPLSDYQPRKHEALERRYLNGAYGGTPVIATPEIVTGH